MRRLTILFVFAATVCAAPASAAGRTSNRQFLTMARGKQALLRATRIDQPASVSFDRCWRLRRLAIRCWVTELGAMNVLTDNGVPTPTDMRWLQTAVLHGKRVRVSLF